MATLSVVSAEQSSHAQQQQQQQRGWQHYAPRRDIHVYTCFQPRVWSADELVVMLGRQPQLVWDICVSRGSLDWVFVAVGGSACSFALWALQVFAMAYQRFCHPISVQQLQLCAN